MSKPPVMSATNIPSEIIEAILPLLPAKSLGRFKSVSKTWNSLISNPQFIKTHLLQTINHHKTTKLILISDTKSLYSLDINQLLPHLNTGDLFTTAKELSFHSHYSPPIKWEQILGSCNGLLLAEDETKTLFLINPTTKELWKVPASPFALSEEESDVMYGFGYDSTTGDYKVVSISFPDEDDIFVSVYSLINNSWRKLHFPYYVVVYSVTSGVLVNENLHWLIRSNLERLPTLAAFNLATEEFNEIELPDKNKFKFLIKRLVAVGGKLGLFDSYMGSAFSVIGGNLGVCDIQMENTDLWVMEEYGVVESWTKFCFPGDEIDPDPTMCLVDGSSNREIVLRDDRGIVMYNMDERRCENVQMEGGVSGVLSIKGKYFESLESPAKCVSRAS